VKSLNQVTILGNLTRDPELRTAPNGQKVCSFSIALNRSYKSDGEWKEATDFMDIVAWGPLGERCGERLKKASSALVNGRLQNRKYEKDDHTFEKTEIVATDVIFVS
jgi:single-strand DNA-binding protein